MTVFDIELQRLLVSASLDDFSPNDALPNSYGGQYGNSPHEWHAKVVDTIHQLLALGLIRPTPGQQGYSHLSADEIASLLKAGDGVNGLDVEVLWDAIHFTGTAKLKELLGNAGLTDWSALNAGLSPELGRALLEMS